MLALPSPLKLRVTAPGTIVNAAPAAGVKPGATVIFRVGPALRSVVPPAVSWLKLLLLASVTLKLDPAANVTPPVTLRLPATAPPACAAIDFTEPVPVSVPPEPTVTALFASDPLTLTVPPLTVVVPLYVLAPASSSVPGPVLVRPKAPVIAPPIRRVSPAALTVQVAGPFSVMPESVSVPLLRLSVPVPPPSD